MKEYIYSVSAILILLTVVELISPKSSIGKPLKIIVSLISVSIILAPITKLFKEDSSVEIIENQQYLEYLNDLEEKTVANQIKMKLNSSKIEYIKLEIDRLDAENEKIKFYVKIYFNKQVINENFSHINSIEEELEVIKKELYLDNVTIEAVLVE